MLLARVSHVFVVGSNNVLSQAEDCWLPTPFASFPFTSPPMRRCVPPDSVSTLPNMYDVSLLYIYCIINREMNIMYRNVCILQTNVRVCVCVYIYIYTHTHTHEHTL